MRNIGVLFLSIPVLFISFIQLSAFSFLEKQEVKSEIVRKKRDAKFKINEEDFINTMFLRSTFFENGSETNYFVNPTLKTSQSLFYNENGYLDFLKDSYATGIVFDKPSDKFLELYQNGDNYVKQYKLDRFYNVDKKFFLKDLTNFMYTYFKKYDGTGKVVQMQQSIKNLEQVKFNEENWKLVSKENYKNEIKNINNKGYIGIFPKMGSLGKSISPYNVFKAINDGKNISIYGKFGDGFKTSNDNVYRGDGNNEPTIPEINKNTGKITKGNKKK